MKQIIDRMRKLRMRYRFTAIEQALFYELLAIAKESESDIFHCSNADLCLAINVGEKSLIKARTSLLKAKLIYYAAGKSKRNVGQYSFQARTIKDTVNTTANTTAIPLFPDKDSDKKGAQETAKRKPFVAPTFEQVEIYCLERKNEILPQSFIDHYTANGWMVGKNKMKDWKAAVRTWENRRKKNETDRTDTSKPKDYTKGFGK